MLNYVQIENKPRLLKSFGGLNEKAFEQLLSSFKRVYNEWLDEKDRKRESPRRRVRGVVDKWC